MNDQKNIGTTTTVKFVQVGKSAEGKVDTGATNSSLHATDIQLNKRQNTVTFRSPVLSQNAITLDLAGVQEVHSADGGGQDRPIVKLDVEINGVMLDGMVFNLNDRSNMDSMILIGQNILKAGNFTIDVNKEADPQVKVTSEDKEAHILTALQVLSESEITLKDLLKYLQTLAVTMLKTPN